MISISKALRFLLSPSLFFIGFINTFISISGIICLIFTLKNDISAIFFGLTTADMLLKKYEIMAILAQVITTVCYFFSFFYFLIVAKKKVFDMNPSFTFSFFCRKAVVLAPFMLGYYYCILYLTKLGLTKIAVNPSVNYTIPVLCILAIFGLSYLFFAFLISYLERFNFDSVKRLFIPTLKKPVRILLIEFCGILFGICSFYIIKLMATATKHLIKYLIPQLLPCSGVISIFIAIIFAVICYFVYKALNSKGRFIFCLSFIFMIPTLFLYHLIDLPFNLLAFLIFGQVIFMFIYFHISILLMLPIFIAHLTSQSSLKISQEEIARYQQEQSI